MNVIQLSISYSYVLRKVIVFPINSLMGFYFLLTRSLFFTFFDHYLKIDSLDQLGSVGDPRPLPNDNKLSAASTSVCLLLV